MDHTFICHFAAHFFKSIIFIDFVWYILPPLKVFSCLHSQICPFYFTAFVLLAFSVIDYTKLIFVFCSNPFGTGLNSAPILQSFKRVACIILFLNKLSFHTEMKSHIPHILEPHFEESISELHCQFYGSLVFRAVF